MAVKYFKMIKHGNTKYDFTPLNNIGGVVEAETKNIYALKSSIRSKLKIGTKGKLFFDEIEPGLFKITRIS